MEVKQGLAAYTMDDSVLKEFFIKQLQDIYWAEKKLLKALPEMVKAATEEALREAFANHLEQTKEHVGRAEQVFDILGETAKARKSQAMSGIIDEGKDIIAGVINTSFRDVALILTGQKAAHYEIATYGVLVTLANSMGCYDIAYLLELNLQDEKDTDVQLTQIADANINYEAAQQPTSSPQ